MSMPVRLHIVRSARPTAPISRPRGRAGCAPSSLCRRSASSLTSCGTGPLGPAFLDSGVSFAAGQAMQFLVYLTVLMVSISTVLLEVHWLTSPPPQPKTVQTANTSRPVPKVEGPTAALSPFYPKKIDTAENTANTQE